jgi:sarcosine oxidase gamma subunit
VSADLAFLSPTATRGAALRTPMDGVHAAAGATFQERDGWRVAVYPERDAPVWAADVSQIGKIELRGGGELDAAVDDALELRLTPRRALVLCDPSSTAEHLAALRAPALDVTCVYAAVRIGGAAVRELFPRVSALDARPRSFADGDVMMGSIARCPGIVVNQGGDRLLLMVGWEYGAYLWETVLDAGAPLGIAPRTDEVLL